MKRHFPLVLLFGSLSLSSLSFAATPMPYYESPEHLEIGNQVKLFFSKNDPGQQGIKLTLPNGLALTYGEILTFGDYYEVPKHPISQGETTSEQTSRFLIGFNSFADNPAVKNEATQLVNLIHQEEKIIDDAIASGKDPEKVYSDIGWDMNRQLNCITGGGCSAAWWTDEGRFLVLAKTDYDHFGDHALLSYQIGHAAAIKQAIKAGQDKSRTELEVAYAMNAFAAHFLSDRFAAGHIRTPRVELATLVTPQVVGSLLSSYMHNEENAIGLHVHNLRGDHWVIYGDRTYLSAKSSDTTRILNEALQTSTQQVFDAYLTGETESDDAVLAYIPIPDEIGSAANIDPASLFYWDESSKTLFRRQDTTNVFDHHWTSNWWGWSTLTELSREHGLPLVKMQ